MIRILLTTALALASCGCARDRDFAVVEPTLSRHYQNGPTATLAAAPPPASGNVVGIQPVSGQKGMVQPVYQTQPPSTAAGAMGSVVLPPASSTETQTGGQPYYVPNAPQVVASPPPPSRPLGAVGPSNAAGAYAAASGMWMPANGNQPIAVHQFSTPTTGSSFIPSVPTNATAGGPTRFDEGIVPAGAMVPFQSNVPQNQPPPQNARSPFLSETGEHQQASRIESRPTKTVPPPGLDDRRGTPMPPTKSFEEPQPPTKRNENRQEPPPVKSSDDDFDVPTTPPRRRPGEVMDANPADPPRTLREKSPSNDPPPKNINFEPEPKAKPKTETAAPPKGLDDLGAPPAAPKKLPPVKKKDDDGPLGEIPDDIAPPKKASGS